MGMRTCAGRECHCGSGKPRYELVDARNIFCGYVCVDCEAAKKAQYRSEIFENGMYECDEAIDVEDY